MKSLKQLLFLSCLLFVFSCNSSKQVAQEDGKIEVVFLQLNDVYEIAPLPGSDVGGLARVATIRKELMEENLNTYTVHAGDFLNPSVIGTLKHEGERIKGKQMVEAMNAMEIDLVTFGNHEFDVDREELQARINESEFSWVSANVLEVRKGGNKPFNKTHNGISQTLAQTKILEFTDMDGTSVSIGVVAVVLPSNPKPHVEYLDVFEQAKKAYDTMAPNCDFVIGLTHLEIEDDLELARRHPEMKLIMGGHDHTHMLFREGETVVAKADANAKTVYIHKLTFDRNTGEVSIDSKLKNIDNRTKADPAVDAVVQKWLDIENESLAQIGISKDKVVTVRKDTLDGLETSIRHHQTNLGQMIAHSFYDRAPKKPDAAVVNSGSIRIDDRITGTLTEYDMVRLMPFGGSVVMVELRGGLLKEFLNTGMGNKGRGGYLQWHNIRYEPQGKLWMISGKPLDYDKNYKIAMNDFLLTGYEENMDFLTEDNEQILSVKRPDKENKDDPRIDVRRAFIQYLMVK